MSMTFTTRRTTDRRVAAQEVENYRRQEVRRYHEQVAEAMAAFEQARREALGV